MINAVVTMGMPKFRLQVRAWLFGKQPGVESLTTKPVRNVPAAHTSWKTLSLATILVLS